MDDLRNVWAITTVDSTGRPAQLFVGEIEHGGQLEAGVRVNDGPIVIVPLPDVVARLLAALRRTSEAAWRKNAEDDR